jgi:hypothetical protein
LQLTSTIFLKLPDSLKSNGHIKRAKSIALTGHGLAFAAVEMVRNGTVAAYMTQLTLLQYLVNQQPCDMAIVEEGFGYGAQVHYHVTAAASLAWHAMHQAECHALCLIHMH